MSRSGRVELPQHASKKGVAFLGDYLQIQTTRCSAQFFQFENGMSVAKPDECGRRTKILIF